MFSFEKQSDGSWCVYIVQQPGYGLRASGAHETHRLGIGSRPYICWNTRIPTYEKARGVAKMWADATQRYIRDGTRF